MKREEIRKKLMLRLDSMSNTTDFIELDSLEKVELIMYCEKDFNIAIPDDEVEIDWNIDRFIEYLYEKINSNDTL